MKFHRNIASSLSHAASWAGFAGIMTSLGSELDKPYNIVCYGFSAVFSVIAILIRTPMDYDNRN